MAGHAGWQLLVLTVVVTAGCGGLGFSGGDGSPTPVTPAPVPTDSATAYPAGVGPAGVTSPSLLGSAHGDRLNGTGYTLTMNRTVRYANGSLRSHLRVHVALDANRTYLTNISVRGHAAPVLLGRPPATASFWSDGDTYLRRLVRDNQTIYNEYDPPDSYAGTWRYWVHSAALNGRPAADVTRTVAPFHTRTTRSQQSDGTAYVIRGDRLRENTTSTTWAARENATLVAHVRQSGLVRYYRTGYTTVTDSGEPVTVTRTVRFTAVGNTTVGPPPWRDRAQSTSG
ncbi:hypothetical protein SAMN05443574_101141 [Haloarcula vallismortis]|uniref:Uncharacterized protein n=2 Tax=Haloarcula vallismortis TaxID=28442 RepID=M0IY55_HALVA|nr:hypothetical protein [Haloarcula vallismortis]EMA00719.1 hypothetical protein C437_18012 [Haloarcula vallismortis ATCC 29715]SDW03994.1 hypothetical protein SAMN05443574_101141 [Haloarcula vallismortis]